MSTAEQTPPTAEAGLPVGRNVKIGFFHLGSGMADILTGSVWNRVMIADLGVSATVVGLLTALKYFLSPLGILAGRLSDQRVIGGYRRLFWIWLGRLLMVLSTIMIGLATTQLARNDGGVLVWSAIMVGFTLFSVGSAISGTTFLALIYDRAPEHQRGRAVGIVWTFLLMGFPLGGILFGVLLPAKPADQQALTGLSFAPEMLQNLFLFAAALFGFLWFSALLGEERRSHDTATAAAQGSEHVLSLRQDLKLVWHSRTMRYFLAYLTLSMFFAFSQDAVLEPFGGDVFGMSASVTNRFAAYWGVTAIVGTILFLVLSRRYPRLTTTLMAQAGAGVLVLAFVLLAAAALLEVRALVTPGLIVMGVGLGVWNVGTLGLMMALSPAGRAGTFLGFWTMAVTLARGGGTTAGGIVRDVGLALSGQMGVAYGSVFAFGAVGLLVSMWALSRVHIRKFKAAPVDSAGVFAGAMD